MINLNKLSLFTALFLSLRGTASAQWALWDNDTNSVDDSDDYGGLGISTHMYSSIGELILEPLAYNYVESGYIGIVETIDNGGTTSDNIADAESAASVDLGEYGGLRYCNAALSYDEQDPDSLGVQGDFNYCNQLNNYAGMLWADVVATRTFGGAGGTDDVREILGAG